MTKTVLRNRIRSELKSFGFSDPDFHSWLDPKWIWIGQHYDFKLFFFLTLHLCTLCLHSVETSKYFSYIYKIKLTKTLGEFLSCSNFANSMSPKDGSRTGSVFFFQILIRIECFIFNLRRITDLGDKPAPNILKKPFG